MQHLWKLITTTKMLRFLKRSDPTLKIFEAEIIKLRSDKIDLISRIFANFPY